MPSDLQVDNIKDGSATKTLAEYSSSAWSWNTPPAGTVLQFLHFENTETNGLDASYTNLYENSITLKSASSDVFVMIQANYILPASQGFGCKIYRNNSATVTTSHTAVWTKNAVGSNPATIYNGTNSQRNDVLNLSAKDSLSGFSIGNTLYYGLFFRITDSSGSAVGMPINDSEDGFFSMQLMEVQK
tara:strand:- start:178 stop:738 length:561 start_codon:yes stop_codon:yes gene_type:complete